MPKPNLIPVFMPSLAVVLAAAEGKKGSALTPAEIVSIRDKSPCIMMESAAAAKLAESRGYIDVNSENAWSDWHRLRVQISGNGYLPKIILCIPGDNDLRARCEPILKSEHIEYEFGQHDPRIVQAFKSSSI